MSSKNIQLLKTPQLSPFNTKIIITPYQSLKLKSKPNKLSQTKKYSLIKHTDNYVTLKNPKQLTKQHFIQQSEYFNHTICLQRNQQIQKDYKKQTFKDFIRKIQSYNQNHLTKQDKDLFQSQIKSNYSLNLTGQQNINKLLDNNLMCPIKSLKQEKQTNILEKQKQNNQQTNQKSRNFIIHNKMNKNLFTRDSRRSKTEQDLKIHKINFPENKNQQESPLLNKCSVENIMFNKTKQKLNSLESSNNHLKYVDIKLIQRQKPHIRTSPSKQFLESNFLLDPSVRQFRNSQSSQTSQKDFQNLSKIFQNKHSKIRIRLGSSLYSKNLRTIQSSNSTSKNIEKKDSQNHITESTIIHNKKKLKNTINSQFWQNKIKQTQKICIQKRRLIPTAEIKNHQTTRQKKYFFTISNSLDKYRKPKIGAEIEPIKVENLNGWQSIDEGVTNFKIEQFF